MDTTRKNLLTVLALSVIAIVTILFTLVINEEIQALTKKTNTRNVQISTILAQGEKSKVSEENRWWHLLPQSKALDATELARNIEILLSNVGTRAIELQQIMTSPDEVLIKVKVFVNPTTFNNLIAELKNRSFPSAIVGLKVQLTKTKDYEVDLTMGQYHE